MSSDPPPTLPTGVSMPQRCVHGGDGRSCVYCKVDDELASNPGLADTKTQPHEFGCPLFERPELGERWNDNYKRIYGDDGQCTCKKAK